MIRIYPIGKALHPRHVFRISRASRVQVDNVFLSLTQDDVTGYGEASPNSFFHEDPHDVQMALLGLSDYFRRQTLTGLADISRIWGELEPRLSPSRACLCAIDVALWDLWAKLSGMSVCEAALGRHAHPVATSATLGICEPEEWPSRIAELTDFPAIKVKMDARLDTSLLEAIRTRSPAALRVDANGAWAGIDIAAASARLAALGVEFIEQPLLPGDDDRMESVLRNSTLPILADESCALPGDIERLPGRFSGFNIKLVKCGGLTPALGMVRRGRELGLKVMIGCMLESSLLIAAGCVAAQDADYADLDGSWLLRDDPCRGLTWNKGRIGLPSTPGLGGAPIWPPD
ncbi:MAG: dipeptide epimerase [Fibrobacteres bacterium]|nr:dipeptide epimerase [Fibrobacterota bacterium]